MTTSTVEVEATALLGPSCKFIFEVGRRYVVYAYGEDVGRLAIGACSRTRLEADAHEDFAYFREMKGPGSGGHVLGSVRHLEPDFVSFGTRDRRPIVGLKIGLQGPGTGRELSTATDGSFDFGGLLPGEYTLSVRPPERMLLEPTLLVSTDVQRPTQSPSACANDWRHIGPSTLLVSSLFAAPWGDVYATGAARDVFRTTDKGARWRPLLLPDEGSSAGALALTKDGNLLLAWSDWVYRSADRGDTWQQVGLNDRVTALFTVRSTGTILAGTSNGLFRSTDNGNTWIERSIGLKSFDVTSLGASDDGALFAGTSAGEGPGEVYRSTDNGDRWRLLAPEFPGGAVNALAALPGGGVVAGTTQGIFRWTPGSRHWEKLFGYSQPTRVSSLVLDGRGRLIAGTTMAGVLVSEDGGDTWKSANTGLPSMRIRAIAVAADGDVYAAIGRDTSDGRPTASAGAVGVFRGRFGAGAAR